MEAAQKPATVGKYSILASLGRGGMATVYLALMSGPLGFNKQLVLKILRDDLETNHEDLTAMFLNEARLAARLHHRCIVQTYEFGEMDGRPFIAMEYLEGQPLRAVQRKFAPSGLPLEEELRILAETARGLHYAHEMLGFDGESLSVVHRDVSPQNVFLTYEGQVKLLDFGIAKIDSAEHLTKVGAIKGKIDYMAPEQVRGDKVDRRADVFALGAMLWEAITGERFGGGNKLAEVTKIHRRLSAAEPPVRELRPDVPDALATLVEDAIRMNPAERLSTAGEFADRIDSYLATLSVRPNEKTLSELMIRRYGEEHTKLRKLIDQQIKAIQERGRMNAGLQSNIRPLDFGLTSTGVLDLGTPSRAPGTFTPAREPPLPPIVAAAPPKRKATWLAGSALALSAVVTTAVVVRGGGDSATAAAPVATTAAPPATAPVQPAPEPSSAVRTVRVAIDVSPASARATLDGAPLSKLPFSGSFQASDAMHHLQVSAEGYQTVRQLVTFEEDRTISITLQPVAAAARPRPTRAGGHASRPVVSSPDPAPSKQAPAAADHAPSADKPSSDVVEFKTTTKSRRFDARDPYAN